MLFSLDYDDTYTADIKFWKEFIELAKKHGHSVVCVTARSNTLGNHEQLKASLPAIPYVLCNHRPKWKVAMQHGYNIDIWIDDTPEAVMEG